MNTGHGCACISDKCSGEILFYTDGTDVWDSTHQVMPNGSGLLGDRLSTQSAIIVPHPDTNLNHFFIFTVQQSGIGGIHYSEVDMGLNGGRGDVIATSKNTPLVSPTVEKLTAIKHQNNEDVWVITHKLYSDEFYVYLIDKNGINPSPFVSAVGPVYNQNAIEGYLKASPDGKFLAAALRNQGTYDVFRFDYRTGKVYFPIRFQANYPGAYGVEFSPDGTKLYTTINSNGLYQFDLTAGNATQIENSGVLISNVPNVAIQLGPDKKIYTNEGRHLGVINDPNESGVACNYVSQAVYLGATVFGNSGLPTFLQSYFSPVDIVESDLCFGQNTSFSISNLQEIDSLNWNFGDPSSGNSNTSKQTFPSHNYANPGNYEVTAIFYGRVCNGVVSDTIKKTIEILNLPAPTIDLGPDTIICEGDSILFDASGNSTTFLWSNGKSGSSIKVANEGLYWVEGSNVCGKSQDSVEVSYFNSILNLDLGDDTSFCRGQSVVIDVSQPDVIYLWNDGNNTGYNTISNEGEYWVQASDKCSMQSDTIKVNILDAPVVSLPADTVLCPGEILNVNVETPGASYEWQDGQTSPEYIVSEEGSYYVNISNQCGRNRTQMTVYYKDCSCTIFIPNSFTPNSDGLNDVLEVEYSCDFEKYQLSIFTRWGEMIYQTDNPNSFWDGTFNGNSAVAGSYIYELEYKGRNNLETRDERRRGIINLIK